VLVAFSVTPIGTGEAVGEAVAEAVRVVRESGLPNRTDAMFTTIEGDWDETMDVVKRGAEPTGPSVVDGELDRGDRAGSHQQPAAERTRPRVTRQAHAEQVAVAGGVHRHQHAGA
jgi:uncharacterized protein YqgV (UPF0045/DUF77 family)